MKTVQELRERKAHLFKAIATVKAELETLDGDAYKGCWLDSSPAHNGNKRYTRLRWFIGKSSTRKGCRTLHGDEVVRATRAIELWTALQNLEAELSHIDVEMRKVEAMAARLGLQVPESISDTQEIPNGSLVRVSSGWKAQIIGYARGDRYHLQFLTGIKGQTDVYPARMLAVE